MATQAGSFQVYTPGPRARGALLGTAATVIHTIGHTRSLAGGQPQRAYASFTAGTVRRGVSSDASYDPRAVAAHLNQAETLAADEVRPPEENKFGRKVIYNVEGRIVAEGDAVSKEALLAQKLSKDPKLDLAGADLSGMNLDKRHNLSNRNLSHARIDNTVFDGCPMENTRLVEAKGNKHTALFNLDKADGLDISGMETKTGLDGKGLRIENVRAAGMKANGANLPGVRISRLHTEGLQAHGLNVSGGTIDKWVATRTEAEGLQAHNVGLGNSALQGNLKGIDLSGSKTKVNNSIFAGDMEGGKAIGATFTGKNVFAAEMGKFDFSQATFRGETDMSRVVTRTGPMHMHGADITGIRQLPTDPRVTIYANTIKNDGLEFKPSSGETAINFIQVKAASQLAKAEMAARNNSTITNLAGLNMNAMRSAGEVGLVGHINAPSANDPDPQTRQDIYMARPQAARPKPMAPGMNF